MLRPQRLYLRPCGRGGMQVKKRCSWLLQFSTQVLAGLPGTPQDPFGGQQVEANALGLPCRQAPLPVLSCSVAPVCLCARVCAAAPGAAEWGSAGVCSRPCLRRVDPPAVPAQA